MVQPLLRRALSNKLDEIIKKPLRSLSTSSNLNSDEKPWYYDDPSQIIHGITSRDIDNDPALATYLATNFSEPLPSLQTVKEIEEEKAESKTKTDSDPLLALNIRRLRCHPRNKINESGSRVCQKMREKDGLIPGLIYGGDKNLGIASKDFSVSRVSVKTPFNEIQRERDRYHHDFECRVYELTVEDKASGDIISTHRVVPCDVNMHPVLNKAYCVNYLRYYPGRPLKIPIKYINEEESPALKRGGFIIPINRHLKCIVDDGVAIPEFIELDCTGAKPKEKMRMDRLIIPDGLTVSKDIDKKDFLVGPVFGRGINDDEV